MSTVKESAINIIKNLPEHATWDDIIYQLYVKEKIDSSLKAAEQGRIVCHENVRKL